jgi:DNA-binding response OmpR family regulator
LVTTPDQRLRRIRPVNAQTVLLVEEDARLLARLAALLRREEAIDMLFTAGGLAEAQALLDRHRPKLLLLDLGLLDAAAEALIARARAAGTRVLMLGVFDGAPRLPAAIAAGAQGWLSKERCAQELRTRIVADDDAWCVGTGGCPPAEDHRKW